MVDIGGFVEGTRDRGLRSGFFEMKAQILMLQCCRNSTQTAGLQQRAPGPAFGSFLECPAPGAPPFASALRVISPRPRRAAAGWVARFARCRGAMPVRVRASRGFGPPGPVRRSVRMGLTQVSGRSPTYCRPTGVGCFPPNHALKTSALRLGILAQHIHRQESP